MMEPLKSLIFQLIKRTSECQVLFPVLGMSHQGLRRTTSETTLVVLTSRFGATTQDHSNL